MKGIPFIVSAPSGAGKTTLCAKAVAFFADLRHSVSYTTRPPRLGEVDGVDYHFVDNVEFDRMVKAGEFLEYAGVHGKRYGTSRDDLDMLLSGGYDVMLDIDVQGAKSVREKISGGVYIFILPPSVEACRQRLNSRGKDSAGEIEKRLAIAIEEIKRASEYEYVIINDAINDAFERFKAVITAEKSKKACSREKVREIFGIDI